MDNGMLIVFAVLLAASLNLLAFNKGYYTLPSIDRKNSPLIPFSTLVMCFTIYLFLSLLVVPIFAKFLLLFLKKADPNTKSLSIPFITGLQFTSMLAIFLFLQTFVSHRNPKEYFLIWKKRDHSPSKSIGFDFGLGAYTWLLSFPIVIALSETIDKILKRYFELENYQQGAVKFFKAAMASPISLTFALGSVILLAPLLEEFLFRGVLQTYIKKRMGAASAILISAFCFSLFHYSFAQGLGNVALLSSLLILGGFLGFLYEKQQSLFASIGLHMTFNTISALRIILSPETL